jgi:hypothetical protein
VEQAAVPAGPALTAQCRFTDATDGDFRIDAAQPELDARRRRVVDAPWTWLTQVHGARVVEVAGPGDAVGVEADAAVTSAVGAPLAIQTADCAPILLVGAGVVGAAHAGWRGLVQGVLEATVEVMRRRSDGPIRAVIGPHISAARYEFGADDLVGLVDRFGPSVAATSAIGTPALDVTEVVRRSLEGMGVTRLQSVGGCTGSSTRWHSHRIRGDRARQASVVWLEERT